MCLEHKTLIPDDKTKERIAHARVCKNWSISENTCYCSKTERDHASGKHEEYYDDGDEKDCRHPDCLSAKIDRMMDMDDLKLKDF